MVAIRRVSSTVAALALFLIVPSVASAHTLARIRRALDSACRRSTAQYTATVTVTETYFGGTIENIPVGQNVHELSSSTDHGNTGLNQNYFTQGAVGTQTGPANLGQPTSFTSPSSGAAATQRFTVTTSVPETYVLGNSYMHSPASATITGPSGGCTPPPPPPTSPPTVSVTAVTQLRGAARRHLQRHRRHRLERGVLGARGHGGGIEGHQLPLAQRDRRAVEHPRGSHHVHPHRADAADGLRDRRARRKRRQRHDRRAERWLPAAAPAADLPDRPDAGERSCVTPSCATGQTLVNGVCMTPSCPSGQSLVGGHCVTPTCTGAACSPQPPTCAPSQTMSGGRCVSKPSIICPAGQVKSGDTCVREACRVAARSSFRVRAGEMNTILVSSAPSPARCRARRCGSPSPAARRSRSRPPTAADRQGQAQARRDHLRPQHRVQQRQGEGVRAEGPHRPPSAGLHRLTR